MPNVPFSKKISSALILSAFALGSAQSVLAHDLDAKARIKTSHDIQGFDKIRITGVYDLDVQVGETFSVTTSGKAKDVAGMKVYLDGKTLVLAQDEDAPKNISIKRRKKNNGGIRAVISLPNLLALDVTGVGTGAISGIDGDDFDADITGVSDLELSGKCGDFAADMTGIGDFDASDLKCENVDVSMAGMGQMSVYAEKSVDADISGMGNIEVYGNPEDVEKDSNFLSSVDIK